jgi:putative endonuclease
MKQTKKKTFGQKSEELAAVYLVDSGYEIVATNWHCPYGELDIVAQKNGVLVFVEVRSRHSHTTETAFASINNQKRAKLHAAALAYLAAANLDDVMWRIDVIAIAVPRDGQPILEHVEDALDW